MALWTRFVARLAWFEHVQTVIHPSPHARLDGLQRGVVWKTSIFSAKNSFTSAAGVPYSLQMRLWLVSKRLFSPAQVRIIPLIAWMALSADGRSASVVVNGEFASSLTTWTVEGSMFNTGASAVFSEALPPRSAIFQSILVNESSGFQLTLDCLNGLASGAGGGFVPDTFFATIYFGTQPFGATISGSVFDTALALFDMDALGPFGVAPGGSFGPSPKGSGWSRFTLDRAAGPGFSAGYLTIAFEMYNLNGVSSDSVVAVDNVSLVAIPEPSAGCLLALSTFLFWRRRAPPANTDQKLS